MALSQARGNIRRRLGLDVHTEGELEDALDKAAIEDALVFIEIHTGRLDFRSASQRGPGYGKGKSARLIAQYVILNQPEERNHGHCIFADIVDIFMTLHGTALEIR